LSKLTDARANPTYKTEQVIMIVLLGFLLRIKSFNELNFMIKKNEFCKLFPRGTQLPQIDTIRDTLKVIGIDELKQIIQHIIKKAAQNA
jgi:transposase